MLRTVTAPVRGNAASHPNLLAISPTAPVITSFNLVDDKTGEVLQSLKDGSVIDVSKYAGRDLNVNAPASADTVVPSGTPLHTMARLTMRCG